VVYSEDNQRVLLSLRQAQILEALAADKDLKKQGGCVPDLQEPSSTEKKTYVEQDLMLRIFPLTIIQGKNHSCLSPRVWSLYVGSHPG
jgi:hypothetical protein